MFNPFGLARQTSINTQKLVVQQYGHSAETSARRSASRANDALQEATDENIELIRENRELKASYDAALGLIRTLADRSEAFRRITHHLRKSWTPNDPSEASLKESIKPLFDSTVNALDGDQAWQAEREERIARLVPGTKPKTRPR